MTVMNESDYLAHYGILRRSGRYPWGSGSTQNVRNKSFLDYVDKMRKEGLTDPEIARGVGISSTQLRAANTIAKAQQKSANVAMVRRLREKGWSYQAIADRMGLKGESSARALDAPGAADKADALIKTSEMLKRAVDEKTFVDVGSGVEHYVLNKKVDIGTGVESYVGISQDRLNAAIAVLKEQGYKVHPVKIPQIGTGLDTQYKILCPPGTTQRDVFLNRDKIQQITEFSSDGGHTFNTFKEPLSLHPDRVQVRYGDEGGAKADGLIQVRPGKEDLSLGGKRYAQVRIKVGDKHYLKGMARYDPDLPPGVDIVFNTEKKNTGNKLDVMKEVTNDPNLPFGSVTRPIQKGDKVTSVMNIVNEEGNWSSWSRNLASQTLSKQSPILARQQLDMTYERRKKEYDEIMKLTNPIVRRRLLHDFAEGADSAAVHLEAAQLPRQTWRVILPMNSLKEHEVYAPGYRDGENVVLIRYPHGGTFEIPQLIVNNKNREGRSILGDVPDAIGIHHKVAEHLSGADFDGDAVLVIPNGSGKVKVTPQLEQLKNFNPREAYPAYEGMPRITPARKGYEMGHVSNLITDMTIRSAPHEDIARAIRHSMVVIDSENHHLNYKQSERDNGIKQLKEKYQGDKKAGASTLLSRAGSEVHIPQRKLRPQSEGGPIDPTGRKVFVDTKAMRTDRHGNKVPKKETLDKLALTDDAHTLSSGTPMEHLYADHSNKLKALANTARLSASKAPSIQQSSSAKRAYSDEVASLAHKLALVQMKRPRERQAQIIARNTVHQLRAANPGLGGDSLKKVKFKALELARERVDAKKELVHITDKEWAAIQAGAISTDRLSKILDKADMDRVKELATPRTKVLMTPNYVARAQAMLARGATRSEVADALGVSLSTLDEATVGEDAS